jgi:hypothetical protein
LRFFLCLETGADRSVAPITDSRPLKLAGATHGNCSEAPGDSHV